MEEFIKNLAELGKEMHAAHTSYSYEQEDGSFIEINYCFTVDDEEEGGEK